MLVSQTMMRSSFKPTEAKPKRGPKLCKCKNRACRKEYHKFNSLQDWCSPDCAVVIAQEREAKRKAKEQRVERVRIKKELEKYKPLKWWRAKAKKAMHEYVRARDEGQPCCSCDTILLKLGRLGGDYDAGHFRSVGSAKHMEFVPNNVWGQCKYCNDTLKSNPQEYERRLRIKIGDEAVDALLADNEPRHYKAHDYQAIEAEYKAKLKALKEKS